MQSYSLSLYWSSHSICLSSAEVQKVSLSSPFEFSLLPLRSPFDHLSCSFIISLLCLFFPVESGSFKLTVLELLVLFSISTSMYMGVGSLSVSTSVSTCTSDSESVVVVSNLFFSLIFLNMTSVRTRVRSRMLSTMPFMMSRLLMFIIRDKCTGCIWRGEAVQGIRPSLRSRTRLTSDLDLLVPSFFVLDVWLHLCRFSFFPIIEKYSLYYVFHTCLSQYM